MKATWFTSLLAGAVFGAVVHALERRGAEADIAIVLPVFLAVVFVGVIGITQIREMHAERKRRGLGFGGTMATPEDFSRFYFPTWGRMFICFLSVVVTVFSLKAWLP